MTSIYAAFACLCVCLYVQAPAEAALTKITGLKRIENGNNFTFIAEYEGDSDVQVKWDHSHPAEQTLEPGTATLTTQKVSGYSRVGLLLGNLHSHYVRIEFNVWGNGSESYDPLNYGLAKVKPSTDQAYIAGETIIFEVEVPMNKGNGFLVRCYDRVYVTGHYIDPKTNRTTGSEQPHFVRHNNVELNGISTTNVTFHSDDIIDGWFPASIGCAAKHYRLSPIRRIMEHIVLSVHQPNKPVSVPS